MSLRILALHVAHGQSDLDGQRLRADHRRFGI
jgi:hypothetical protein